MVIRLSDMSPIKGRLSYIDALASIHPTNPRTNLYNFHKKILRVGGVENVRFFFE